MDLGNNYPITVNSAYPSFSAPLAKSDSLCLDIFLLVGGFFSRIPTVFSETYLFGWVLYSFNRNPRRDMADALYQKILYQYKSISIIGLWVENGKESIT